MKDEAAALLADLRAKVEALPINDKPRPDRAGRAVAIFRADVLALIDRAADQS